MTYFLLNIALALTWAALTGNFDPANLVTGFALGYGALFVVRRALEPSDYFLKVWQVIGFVLFFLWELILANLRVAHDVLTPRYHMKPRVIGIPLDARTDAEITALAILHFPDTRHTQPGCFHRQEHNVHPRHVCARC
jgi:multicomponent Na+:H+ antiporter subunit E